jgi:hypothetical protein
MRYRIEITKQEDDSQAPVVVYSQVFDELDVHELITRINHKPRARNRTPRKKEAAK